MTVGVIADMILAKTRQIGVGNSLETQLFMETIKNFEVVKERLYCQIVNTERNKAFLEEAVHKEILDLSYKGKRYATYGYTKKEAVENAEHKKEG